MLDFIGKGFLDFYEGVGGMEGKEGGNGGGEVARPLA